jgi:deoxyribodipyrimidine photo-lyase
MMGGPYERGVSIAHRAAHLPESVSVTKGTPRDRVTVALFTQDLRVHDNPVLRGALAAGDAVVPLFVLDDGIAATGFAARNRSAFLADCLTDLDASLRKRGGRLVTRRGPVVQETLRVVAATGAESVHIAGGVSRYAAWRETALLHALGDRLHVYENSLTVLAPGDVVPAGKDHYAVFTPYARAWGRAARRAPVAAPRRIRVPDSVAGVDLPTVSPDSPALPPGGETEGRRRWRDWVRSGGLSRYADTHDDLAGDETSRMSPYLHFGCVSAGELAHTAQTTEQDPGPEAFVRQLVWRDFHHQVLAARPECSVEDYRPRGHEWVRDRREADAWRAGLTGFPIIDAGMRQLAYEGWMHNRARLLTASFLVKTLRHDWREGAAHFLALLVDGDVADNQMNWQWMAGTGTDTRPNRVLNPLTQARRLDPDGGYVRRWVPELADVKGAAVHRPWTLRSAERLHYPPPLIAPDALAKRWQEAD